MKLTSGTLAGVTAPLAACAQRYADLDR